jgi:hypothetical protein
MTEGEECVTLYYLSDGARSFFAEVGIDSAQNEYVALRSFSSSGPLEDYISCMRLPEGRT